MNILCEELPQSFIISGEEYPIKTDFKTWIRVGMILSDKSLDAKTAVLEVLKAVFFLPPKKIDEAVYEIISFYTKKNRYEGKRCEAPSRAVYDFSYDAELIYSAFLSDYGIDLLTAKLHWWQFLALFYNLSDKTQFIKVVGYRRKRLSEISDKREKQFYKRMKDYYRLPDNRTVDEKEADAVRAISAVFS